MFTPIFQEVKMSQRGYVSASSYLALGADLRSVMMVLCLIQNLDHVSFFYV